MNIDIWSDIACPWCFIGKRRFEAALADFPHRDDVEVRWHSYQLDPSLPEHYDGTELDYLATRKGMPRDRVAEMFAQVTQVAAGEGLAYDFDTIVVANSLRGHQLLHLAAAHGVADEVKERLLSAHFEHGVDIGNLDALAAVGVAAGLDADEIRDVLETGTHLEAVHADIRQAQSIGVTGVPFFVLDAKYAVSGAQPTALFAQALDQAWRESHPLAMVTAPSDGVDSAAASGACGPDGCPV